MARDLYLNLECVIFFLRADKCIVVLVRSLMNITEKGKNLIAFRSGFFFFFFEK